MVEIGGSLKAVVGNEATNHGVVEIQVGLCGSGENESGVVCVTEIEGRAQDHVEKVVVLVEAEAEEEAVDMFEVFDGVEALREAVFDLQE